MIHFMWVSDTLTVTVPENSLLREAVESNISGWAFKGHWVVLSSISTCLSKDNEGNLILCFRALVTCPWGSEGNSASRDCAEFNWPSTLWLVFRFLWSLRYWLLPEGRYQTDDTQILSAFNISGLPGSYTNISAPPPPSQLQIYAITRGGVFWLSSKALKRKTLFICFTSTNHKSSGILKLLEESWHLLFI